MLKATGIVRPVDDLGRVVLPISLRREFGIEPKDDMEVYVESKSIILQKYAPGCIFCGGYEDVSEFKRRIICRACAGTINSTSGRKGQHAFSVLEAIRVGD